MMAQPTLGLIFKPKNGRTIRNRLGAVNELVVDAERTGRCIVLEGQKGATGVAPVVLAALASDLAVHGHLCAGTAGIECALLGIPTLLIDREMAVSNKLRELPEDSVVFRDWPSAIEAIRDSFQSRRGIPGFGYWGDILDELDPFRDGKASNRAGTYLRWLVDGLDKGMDTDLALDNASARYCEKWGRDKVFSI